MSDHLLIVAGSMFTVSFVHVCLSLCCLCVCVCALLFMFVVSMLQRSVCTGTTDAPLTSWSYVSPTANDARAKLGSRKALLQQTLRSTPVWNDLLKDHLGRLEATRKYWPQLQALMQELNAANNDANDWNAVLAALARKHGDGGALFAVLCVTYTYSVER